MRPFLRNGTDCVNLSPIGLHRPERGMVVLFRYRGRHILHRICRIDAEEAVIEGDGNYRQKERIRPGDITAYVDSIERNGRHIDYGSVRWHLLTVWSLAVKSARHSTTTCAERAAAPEHPQPDLPIRSRSCREQRQFYYFCKNTFQYARK